MVDDFDVYFWVEFWIIVVGVVLCFELLCFFFIKMELILIDMEYFYFVKFRVEVELVLFWNG